MDERNVIYLDNAATSFPKPYAVSDAVKRFMLYCGGNAGRGGYRSSLEAAEIVFSCREKLTELFENNDPELTFFTMNTTQGINLCIKGILRKGDHILISDLEHNSVYRPIYKLFKRGYIQYDVFTTIRNGRRLDDDEILKNIAQKVRKNTTMLFCTGASNICSVRLPLEKIGGLCREKGITFAVDGAQAAGHFDISMKKMNIDVLCVPGHKGLLGPQGCGAVLLADGVKMQTLFEGGNGVDSLTGEMSEESPERYEAGTLPIPAIAGLGEGIDVLRGIGVGAVEKHASDLFSYAKQKFEKIDGIRVFAPDCEGAVMLFSFRDLDSEEVAKYLDSCGICARGGYHCAAIAHRTLGTLERGGVRISFGIFNNERHIDSLCEALKNYK